MAIKGQALADFLSEWLETHISSEIKELQYWEMYFDRSSQLQGAGAGVSLLTPKKESFKYVFASSLASLGVQRIDVFSDSALVINQIN